MLNRFLAAAVLAVLLVPAMACQAQVPDRDAQIAGALLAAPEALRAAATVYGYDAAGQLVTIREGDGELICIADKPDDERYHAACYHVALEPYMQRGRELRTEGITGYDSFEARHQEADAGQLKMPEHPATVYNLTGDTFDPATGEVTNPGRLYAVYIPYATSATTGLPETAAGPGTPWIMRPGTASAHIMILPVGN